MHFLNTIIVALLASSAAAYTFPTGQTDGTYVAYYDEEGREVHELRANVNTTVDDSTINTRQEAPDFQNLNQRQLNTDTLHCGCGFNMDPGNCDAAVADLSYQLDHDNGGCGVIQDNTAWYSIRGDVVALIRNRHGAFAAKRMATN